MRVSFPLMGTIEILLKDLCQRLEVEAILPPKSSAKTLSLGVKYAPEFACLPLKITTGNFIEAIDLGADTLIMAGGTGPCRFGYYAQVQKRILENLGLDFKMLIIEPPLVSIRDFIGKFKYLSPQKSTFELWEVIKTTFTKGQALDEVEKKALQTRAFEKKRGETTKAYKKALKISEKAQDFDEIERAKEESFNLLEAVEKDESRKVLKVGIVGEFYVLLEPFVNFNIEEFLGERGLYLERAVYLTDWIGPTQNNPVLGISDDEIVRSAQPYLSHSVGGEGQATIGHIVKLTQEGFDGIIHLFPFTCMPETIAKSIFPKLSRDLDIPILSLVIDEQTGKAGLTTRLEAFIDLLHSRRQRKPSLMQNARLPIACRRSQWRAGKYQKSK